MQLVELDGMKDALVSIPDVSGLFAKQRKRLVIADAEHVTAMDTRGVSSFNGSAFCISELQDYLWRLGNNLHYMFSSSFSISLISLKHEIDKPVIEKRIENAVRDKQEVVVVTTEIQEDLLLKMGIDPPFGIACLGKVNTVYENDREQMVQFYDFVN